MLEEFLLNLELPLINLFGTDNLLTGSFEETRFLLLEAYIVPDVPLCVNGTRKLLLHFDDRQLTLFLLERQVHQSVAVLFLLRDFNGGNQLTSSLFNYGRGPLILDFQGLNLHLELET